MPVPRSGNGHGPGPFKVLFCGRDMRYGYEFTRDALAGEPGVAVVQCERAELAAQLANADVAVPLMSRLDAPLLRAAPRLKLIIQYGVGVEGIDVPTATELGVWVCNIPSAGTGNAASCAEHAIYLMLATLRSHNAMADSIRQRRLGVPLGQTLLGKTVLIIGFGNIAKELAVRLVPFGVRVTALRRKPWSAPQANVATGGEGAANGQQQGQQQRAGQQLEGAQLAAAAEAALADRGCWPGDAARLAREADLVAVTCHQDEHNRGMVGAEFLACCKPGARIVNVARGGLLDYEAVRDALGSGHVAGLGLDVQDDEPVDPTHWLASHPAVYLTPHVAGVTEMSYRAMAEVVAAAAKCVRDGRAPRSLLNDPPQPRALDWFT